MVVSIFPNALIGILDQLDLGCHLQRHHAHAIKVVETLVKALELVFESLSNLRIHRVARFSRLGLEARKLLGAERPRAPAGPRRQRS